MINKIEIVKELSFLYELSLSIGGTLSLEKTCEDFLQVFMRQKNIDFGSIWLKNTNEIDKKQFTLIYAEPSFLVLMQEENLAPNFLKKLSTEKAIKLSVEEAQSFDLIKEKNVEFGTYWFLEIQGIGFIKFFFNESNPSKAAFTKQEIKKSGKGFAQI